MEQEENAIFYTPYRAYNYSPENLPRTIRFSPTFPASVALVLIV